LWFRFLCYDDVLNLKAVSVKHFALFSTASLAQQSVRECDKKNATIWSTQRIRFISETKARYKLRLFRIKLKLLRANRSSRRVVPTATSITVSSSAQTEVAVSSRIFVPSSTQSICDKPNYCCTIDADTQVQQVSMSAACTQTIISDFEELFDKGPESHGFSLFSQSSSECLEAECRAYDDLELCFEGFQTNLPTTKVEDFTDFALDTLRPTVDGCFAFSDDHFVDSGDLQTDKLEIRNVADAEHLQLEFKKQDKPTEFWCVPVPCDEFDEDFESVPIHACRNRDDTEKAECSERDYEYQDVGVETHQLTLSCSFSTLLEICASASSSRWSFAKLGSLARFRKHLVVTAGTLAEHCCSRSFSSRTVCLRFDKVTSSSNFCCVICHSPHFSFVDAEDCCCQDELSFRDKVPIVPCSDLSSGQLQYQPLNDSPLLWMRAHSCVSRDNLQGIIYDPGSHCNNPVARHDPPNSWSYCDNSSLRSLSIVDRFAFCQTQETLRVRRLQRCSSKGDIVSLAGYVQLVSCDAHALYRCSICNAWYQSFAPCFVCNCLMCSACEWPSLGHKDFALTCSCEQLNER